MYQKEFCLKRTDSVLLYGAATAGSIMLKKLQDAGFHVAGFLDKRADEIRDFYGLKVCEASQSDVFSKESVVIIAVKNVFEHSRIVQILKKYGYYKIIYRPFQSLNAQEESEAAALGRIYDFLLSSPEKVSEELAVPIINETNEKLAVQGIINKDTNITMYVPVSLLFTDKKEGIYDVPVLCLKPHMNYVRYLLGMEGGEKESYLNYCMNAARCIGEIRITKKWKENVLSNRAEVFTNMHYMMNTSPDFFTKNAPDAVWDDEGKKFHLKSGKHRTAFLLAAGCNYVPVKITQSDYKKYSLGVQVQEIHKILLDNHVKGLSIPIENPFFYDYARLSEAFWFGILRAVMNEFNAAFYDRYVTRGLGGLKLKITFDKDGFLKRYFQRAGCIVYGDTNDKESPLECVLSELVNMAEAKKTDTKIPEQYDFAVCGSEDAQLIKADRIICVTSSTMNERLAGQMFFQGLEYHIYTMKRG